MTETVHLTEYEDWIGQLDWEDAEFINHAFYKKLNISRSTLDDRYVINPNQYVGVVTLPSGRRLESYPKVPVQNLFFMLAVAFDFPSPFRQGEVNKFDRLEEVFEFVADYFAEQMEYKIDHGLYRSYIETEENLAMLRGRINFVEDIRNNYVLRHRIYCRYADFTWDIPENQVLREVAHMLSGWPFSPKLTQRLSRIDGALTDVTPTIIPVSALDRFQYNRLNEDYRPLHHLCRLFLEGASLSEDIGSIHFQTFLLDMNILFQVFLTKVLQDKAPLGITVGSRESTYLAEQDKVVLKPDIVLLRRGKAVLVADFKYKRLEADEFKNHDIYQLLAYCTAMQVSQGLLIYPQHVLDIHEEIQVRKVGITIRQITVNLGIKPDEFFREYERLADEVFTMIGESRTAKSEPLYFLGSAN